MSPETIKSFDPSLATILSNLGNGRVNIKFSNSVLVQKILLHGIVTSY